MSAALFEVIGHVEVVLRNSIHQEMVSWCRANGHDENWFLNGHGFLDHRAVRDVEKVLNRLRKSDSDLVPDELVSELNFGFWRYLMTTRYLTNLWVWAISKAFPAHLTLETRPLFSRVRRTHRLRNLVAHHEPIFSRRIDLVLLDAYLVVRAIDPEIERWVRERSRVEELLIAKP